MLLRGGQGLSDETSFHKRRFGPNQNIQILTVVLLSAFAGWMRRGWLPTLQGSRWCPAFKGLNPQTLLAKSSEKLLVGCYMPRMIQYGKLHILLSLRASMPCTWVFNHFGVLLATSQGWRKPKESPSLLRNNVFVLPGSLLSHSPGNSISNNELILSLTSNISLLTCTVW